MQTGWPLLEVLVDGGQGAGGPGCFPGLAIQALQLLPLTFTGFFRQPEFFQGVRPLELGDIPRRQDEVEVYGFPEGGDGLSVTAGIVSRVELGMYARSLRLLLKVQIDAAVNSGNSGGPAISGGKLVGIAIQGLKGAENVNDIVPVLVIEHFLRDVQDGVCDGVPELGVAPRSTGTPSGSTWLIALRTRSREFIIAL